MNTKLKNIFILFLIIFGFTISSCDNSESNQNKDLKISQSSVTSKSWFSSFNPSNRPIKYGYTYDAYLAEMS